MHSHRLWNRWAPALALSSFSLLHGAAPDPELLKARDGGNLQALDSIIARAKTAADSNAKSAEAQYKLALAYSYAAEVATEQHDKRKAEGYATAGLDAANHAVASDQSNAEYHRILGALCGQVIPANPLMGALKYGSCARDEINKALSLNGNLAVGYLSRGVGNYYLPAQMGGGVDLALKDIEKAIALDPKLADAFLWKGIILRKANRNGEARQAFSESLRLDGGRIWTKQQLDKTPAQ